LGEESGKTTILEEVIARCHSTNEAKNGKLRSGMPSWSRLPDQQLSQIVAYLQVLANSRE